ncbi:CGNR zinc finger domain-containing protein [Planotetraspora sp. A-T 1434]|uniref:CGNR zinc finger domain-containing protein n=1 Tax=Planotetraspora sp. A-T 1434 TaxID=2979219 RepID=UPI0021C168D6|nr:CGNR zinc finger domain-containing protein [Planotetraspora sp. A-T 1434]MCT9929631.1 CGNR zinc finger domain-containing protein [Planotetraspora sp. A-T 1434]
MDRYLALELAVTIRHDGQGGVADDLETVQGLTDWVRDRAELLDARDFVADEASRVAVVAIRQGVRALFARAVSPAPPSPADAHRLLPLDQALTRINAAAALQPVTPLLDWPADTAPTSMLLPTPPDPDAAVRLTAALARAAIEFLSGPQRERLHACTAPRCVRYFIKEHGRQEWCKPSCGNRARAARHYQRRRAALEETPQTRLDAAPSVADQSR